ncbi:hypothetical protein ONZ45_g293 [Pleurotus djamor]|nr:hypothetical protein ONZ45_g293 [Pleurotus djamor]
MAELLLKNQKTESTFEEIPIIDLADAWSSDVLKRRKLAEVIRDACVNVGFFYVANHGIPQATIDAAIEGGKTFFELPEDAKMSLDIHKSPNFKGYTALLAENNDPKNKGDLHEGYDIGYEADGPDGVVSGVQTMSSEAGGNVWPAEADAPGFREGMLAYYHAALSLGRSLFPLFALALDLNEHWFDEKTKNSAAILRVLHYPPQAPSTLDSGAVIGIGAHTDFECFTLLYQDEAGGLQVQNTNGEWIDAVPVKGTIVVNLGDQFARWTNDTFKSTPHRAINKSGKERYSMPLFFGTDYDVLLEPISTCVSPTNPPKYEVIKAGDYVKARLEAAYT